MKRNVVKENKSFERRRSSVLDSMEMRTREDAATEHPTLSIYYWNYRWESMNEKGCFINQKEKKQKVKPINFYQHQHHPFFPHPSFIMIFHLLSVRSSSHHTPTPKSTDSQARDIQFLWWLWYFISYDLLRYSPALTSPHPALLAIVWHYLSFIDYWFQCRK